MPIPGQHQPTKPATSSVPRQTGNAPPGIAPTSAGPGNASGKRPFPDDVFDSGIDPVVRVGRLFRHLGWAPVSTDRNDPIRRAFYTKTNQVLYTQGAGSLLYFLNGNLAEVSTSQVRLAAGNMTLTKGHQKQIGISEIIRAIEDAGRCGNKDPVLKLLGGK